MNERARTRARDRVKKITEEDKRTRERLRE